MNSNRITHAPIRGYQIIYGKGEYFGYLFTGNEKSIIQYIVRSDDMKVKNIICERDIFPTKEELLNSL